MFEIWDFGMLTPQYYYPGNDLCYTKINKRFHSWELVDGTNRVILVPPKPVIAILKILHSTMRQLRAIQHFNLVELDDLRRNCHILIKNKILAFINL